MLRRRSWAKPRDNLDLGDYWAVDTAGYTRHFPVHPFAPDVMSTTHANLALRIAAEVINGL
jgi:hypothetical protein